MTDYEAREVLRLTSIERKLRGFLRAFADEIDALACSLGHRAPDRALPVVHRLAAHDDQLRVDVHLCQPVVEKAESLDRRVRSHDSDIGAPHAPIADQSECVLHDSLHPRLPPCGPFLRRQRHSESLVRATREIHTRSGFAVFDQSRISVSISSIRGLSASSLKRTAYVWPAPSITWDVILSTH